ncbi:efflux RND transporter permease subunit [Desulfurivibrio alkaliphilus]|uniref:Heavy metal efflux pump, CzcA family n=1 Tax=Desulfurivibrio alkaliphilus (strain DSM 19089 / UNIQEM U267 / AHT2) TaxID=589865 RepID=D6Z0C5_DESAT|nr:efflux RND transporter permease subunit [Desulfurivibrio alkaliphilus]ADH87158.1 heavy metal efflux pump, CzcA family [Desulfurivibrio alkaliphilus AHT 2]
MIAAIIRWSLANRLLVLLASIFLALWGFYSLQRTPLDAIPDLSDVQVIIKTTYPGQSPQVVEQQVTYPLSSALLAVPKATAVRGYSMFGDSYIYVIFEDGTDLYWARGRVLEYLSQAAGSLPEGATPALGPDATGVGWVYQYALVDRSGNHDLGQLRAIQDWFLKYELQTVAGVSEVATVGGMVRQYQIVVDPHRLRSYGLSTTDIANAVRRANLESGGSAIEMAEAEYMIRAKGYIENLDDLRRIPVKIGPTGTPLLLGEVAEISTGPQMRRGIAELDGLGEVVGGIVVMRSGENARAVIEGVKSKLAEIRPGLPPGVEIVETYDRSAVIERAVANLKDTLIKELIVVVLVCLLFLLHLRSSLVIAISLPLGVLGAFVIMHLQGINANIMSLGGIAIAIGAMVDAAIVMIENVHKHLERRKPANAAEHWAVIERATLEVGPALFFALLIITISFLPVFTLEAQEGRLFSPLAFTKTYAMAVAAGLAITLVPVLMGYCIRGRIIPEHKNPANRMLIAAYRPVIRVALGYPKTIVFLTLVAALSMLYPATRLGSEFMPDLDEGDLMYMPTTLPGLSAGKAAELLQQTDRLIKTVPEVKTVFGKTGRAETATDPAPLTMLETTIQLKPRDQWRPGMTTEKLIRELDAAVQLPGVTNAWVMPIRTRIDMLATGIRTPVGIKVAGADLAVIQEIGERIEEVIKGVPGTSSVYSERVTGGRYIEVEVNRPMAARYGLNVADVHEVIRTAVGGMNIGTTVEGLERYPINLRYPRDLRDSLEKLRQLPLATPGGAWVALEQVATVTISDGPPMIRSENARLSGWTYVDIQGRDLGGYVAEAREAVARYVEIPPGYSIGWSGQYEHMARANERLKVVVPLTLIIIMLFLYLSFGRMGEAVLIMATLPLSLVGGFWLLYLLDYNLSIAVSVGFIALAGVAAETGVVMLVYLDQALKKHRELATAAGRPFTVANLLEAVVEGALLRVRPKIMTVATIIIGLLPIMLSTGTGSEVMRRIAAPMVGGMVSATILTLVVLPSVFFLWKKRQTS